MLNFLGARAPRSDQAQFCAGCLRLCAPAQTQARQDSSAFALNPIASGLVRVRSGRRAEWRGISANGLGSHSRLFDGFLTTQLALDILRRES